MPIGSMFMVLNATFDNGVPVDTADLSGVTDKTSTHNVISSKSLHQRDFDSQLLMVKGTHCTGSCKSNDNKITTTMVTYH